MKSFITLLALFIVDLTAHAQQIATITASAGINQFELAEGIWGFKPNNIQIGNVYQLQLGIPISSRCQLITSMYRTENEVDKLLVERDTYWFNSWKKTQWTVQTFMIGLLGTVPLTKHLDADLSLQMGMAAVSPATLDYSYAIADINKYEQILTEQFNTNILGFNFNFKWNINKSYFIKGGFGLLHLLESDVKKTQIETIFRSSGVSTGSLTSSQKMAADILSLNIGLGVNIAK